MFIIKNSNQKKITEQNLEIFENNIKSIDSCNQFTNKDVKQCCINGYLSMISDFNYQLKEYQQLTTSFLGAYKPSLEECLLNGQEFIKLRLSWKLTEEDFAKKLEISLKQLIKYEQVDHQETPLCVVTTMLKIFGLIIKR